MARPKKVITPIEEVSDEQIDAVIEATIADTLEESEAHKERRLTLELFAKQNPENWETYKEKLLAELADIK